MLWLGTIVVAIMLAVATIGYIRRKRDASLKADRPAFTLEELRRLRSRGEVTEPEYETLRQKVLAGPND